MSNLYPARLSMPDLGARTSEAAIDYALTLLMADEIEPSLRWGAAALECHPLMPAALLVTSRGLDQMGRARAAAEGFRMAAQQAVNTGDLPLALAAVDDLRLLGSPVEDLVDRIATTFGRGSPRLREASGAAPLQYHGFLQPLSPFLAGPPLASKATQIVQAAKRSADSMVADEPALAPLPFFSALSDESLRRLIPALRVITVPAGQRLIQEGEPSSAAFVMARGEVEIARSAARGENRPTLVLARLGVGAFFGELSLLSGVASGASVTATRPSILLVADRDVLLALAAKHPELSVQLAAHCRRHALANLGRASPLVAALPDAERATLVERVEMRVFEAGERVARDGTDAEGLHFIVSGEVAVVAREGAERVVLAILNLGETIGESELVLCQRRYADAVAMRPTATLFLSREEYHALVQDHPAILHSLYAMALRRHTETRLALAAGSGSAVQGDALPFLAADDEEPTLHRATKPGPFLTQASSPAERPAIPSPANGAPAMAAAGPPPASQRAPESIVPASVSLPPRSRPPSASSRSSPTWLAAAGAAVGAAVASLIAVMALGGRVAAPPQAASFSVEATPVPAVRAIVAATATPTAPVQPVAPAAPPIGADSAAAPVAAPGVPRPSSTAATPAPPPAVAARPPSAVRILPAERGRVAPASARLGGGAAGLPAPAGSASARQASSLAPGAGSVAAASSGRSATRPGAAQPDEFGGRE